MYNLGINSNQQHFLNLEVLIPLKQRAMVNGISYKQHSTAQHYQHLKSKPPPTFPILISPGFTIDTVVPLPTLPPRGLTTGGLTIKPFSQMLVGEEKLVLLLLLFFVLILLLSHILFQLSLQSKHPGSFHR